MTTARESDTQLRAEILGERLELAEVLGGLPPDSWDQPTLCAGWRVRELVAHMTMPFRYSSARFLAELARSGGKFNRMSDRCARRDAAAPGADLARVLHDNAAHPWQPPGGGFESALIHDVIHGLDFTVPLDTGRRVPERRLLVVLAGLTRPKPLGFFGTDLSGVELRAQDIDWSFGSGAPVTGMAQDLALVLCGRKLPAGRLHGDHAARFSYV